MSKLPDEVVEACRRQVDHAINEADSWADVDDDDCLTAVKVTLATMKLHGWVPERDWETIDKAPRDRTPIQVFHDMWNCPVSVRYMPEGYENLRLPWVERTLTHSWPEEAFTHFKPMPDPPGESE